MITSLTHDVSVDSLPRKNSAVRSGIISTNSSPVWRFRIRGGITIADELCCFDLFMDLSIGASTTIIFLKQVIISFE